MTISVNYSVNTPKYCRLLEQDIKRIPDKRKATKDFYDNHLIVMPKDNKKDFRKKFFSVATFGLVGLWLAHRNNLFNPIKREAKRIIRDEKFQNSIKDFVDNSVSENRFVKATKKYLDKIIHDKGKSDGVIAEAQKALDDKEVFDKLFSKVRNKLNDDAKTLNEGYTVDILDRLLVKIEKNLTKSKEHGLPYKNQSEKIINTLHSNNNAELLEILDEAIINRSQSTIDEFIKNAANDAERHIVS